MGFSLLSQLLKSTMEDVKDLSVTLTKWHKYSPQYKVELTKNGNKMDRTVVMNYPSVAVVIFNKTRQKLVLIKQFRIQHMFASIRENVLEPTADDHQKMNEICKDVTDVGLKGIADFEICAGLCDKEGKSDLEIAVEEVEEECGYKVHPDQMELVQKFCENGTRKTIYYVEVTDDQKVSNGGGLEEEGEMIEVIEMSVDELKANLEKKELLKTNGRNLVGLYWFLAKKSNCLQTKLIINCSNITSRSVIL